MVFGTVDRCHRGRARRGGGAGLRSGRGRAEGPADRADGTPARQPPGLRDLRARAQQLRLARRRQITAARRGLRPQVEALQASRAEAVKASGRAYTERGLYWASGHVVLRDHAVAVKLVDKRRAGSPPGCTTTPTTARASSPCSCNGYGHHPAGPGSGHPARRGRADARANRREDRAVGTHHHPHPEPQDGRPCDRDGARPAAIAGLARLRRREWLNVFQLRPWLPPEQFAALPRGERRRVARTGEVVLTVGGKAPETIWRYPSRCSARYGPEGPVGSRAAAEPGLCGRPGSGVSRSPRWTPRS